MKDRRNPEDPRLLVVGAGKVATQFLAALLFHGFPGAIAVFTRDGRPRPGLNLSLFSAWAGTGRMSRVEIVPISLADTTRVAEWLDGFRPDIIVHAATLYPSDAIAALPADCKAGLEMAGIGAFLPCHLALLIDLLAGVKAAGISTDVVNCAYPDAANAAIGSMAGVRLLGSGNVNNNIPALRCAAAELLAADPRRIEVRAVMHHAVSHRIHRKIAVDDDSYALQILLDGDDVSARVPAQQVFDLISTTYSRYAGEPGIGMAAASTVSVVTAALGHRTTVIHMPGPEGLVGGYPVRLGGGTIELQLPFNMTLECAVSLNERAQSLDGIERVECGKGVVLSGAAVNALRAVLGFGERRMGLADSRELADELVSRCRALGKPDRPEWN